MERKLQHFSHRHPLILKAEDSLRVVDSDIEAVCRGCDNPISGPYYGCDNIWCKDILWHKVCAEMPNEMNHSMHPQHPLTLITEYRGDFTCNICRMNDYEYYYGCSICKFYVDMKCATAAHTIKDKCHYHPLTPLQLPISFPCHICQKKEEGLSYKCNLCPFWVHQNCTLMIPETVKHNDHTHLLKLLPSLSLKHVGFCKFCQICYKRFFPFQCMYGCVGCMFYAHVSCSLSEESSSMPRDLAILPVQQKSTDLISWFSENYRERDAITNLLLGLDETHIDQDTIIKKEIKFFSHEHPLSLVDDQVSEVICDACALLISSPFYGCIDCDYFIHKSCTDLPKQILHPIFPFGPISLRANNETFRCDICFQWSNGFAYQSLKYTYCIIDIKCASLLRLIKHEGHKHPLIPTFKFSPFVACNACADSIHSGLQCATCSFNLCFKCAMLPSVIKHRYDEHPFELTYCPPENHHNAYICELCEKDLNPMYWFYHCGQCDRFTHTYCMRWRGADSNIKYGKRYKFEVHEHKLSLVSCTHSGSFCKKCCLPMRTGYNVGFECITCDFRIHFLCAFKKGYLNTLN